MMRVRGAAAGPKGDPSYFDFLASGGERVGGLAGGRLSSSCLSVCVHARACVCVLISMSCIGLSRLKNAIDTFSGLNLTFSSLSAPPVLFTLSPPHLLPSVCAPAAAAAARVLPTFVSGWIDLAEDIAHFQGCESETRAKRRRQRSERRVCVLGGGDRVRDRVRDGDGHKQSHRKLPLGTLPVPLLRALVLVPSSSITLTLARSLSPALVLLARAETNQSHFTKLVPKLEGIDPDDAFSAVPYEKGALPPECFRIEPPHTQTDTQF